MTQEEFNTIKGIAKTLGIEYKDGNFVILDAFLLQFIPRDFIDLEEAVCYIGNMVENCDNEALEDALTALFVQCKAFYVAKKILELSKNPNALKGIEALSQDLNDTVYRYYCYEGEE